MMGCWLSMKMNVIRPLPIVWMFAFFNASGFGQDTLNPYLPPQPPKENYTKSVSDENSEPKHGAKNVTPVGQ